MNSGIKMSQEPFEGTLQGLIPDGSGQIWLDNVRCTGNEKNLSSCSHSGWGVHNCRHYDDAGVECLSTGNCINIFNMNTIVSLQYV